MFNPSVSDVRNFFFNTYDKGIAHQELTQLEKIAFSVILEHREYHPVLANREKNLQREWFPEDGETNPFLHLSMHVSILEQLSIDQPAGIKGLFEELLLEFGDEHEALHQMIDCLAEMIWQSQHSNMQPNPEIYLSCLRGKLAKE